MRIPIVRAGEHQVPTVTEHAHDALNRSCRWSGGDPERERKRYQQQLSLAERQVAIARVEIEAQNLRADQLKTLVGQED